MTEETAVHLLAREADRAARFCKFCQEYGHSQWDCMRYVFYRLEKIEVGITEAGIPDMRPLVVVVLIVLGGIVGGLAGAIFSLAMRGQFL